MKAIQYDDASKTYRVIDKTTPFAVILALCTVGMEINFYVNHEKEFAPGKKLNDYINRDFDKLKIKLDQDGKYRDCNGKVFNNLAEYDSHCLAYVYAPVPPLYRQCVPKDVSVQSIRVNIDGNEQQIKDFIDKHDTIVFRETKHKTVDASVMDYYNTRGMIMPIDEGYSFPCVNPDFYFDDAVILESLRISKQLPTAEFVAKGKKAVDDLLKRECEKVSDAVMKEAELKAKTMSMKRSRDLCEEYKQTSSKRAKFELLAKANDLRKELAKAETELTALFPVAESAHEDEVVGAELAYDGYNDV